MPATKKSSKNKSVKGASSSKRSKKQASSIWNRVVSTRYAVPILAITIFGAIGAYYLIVSNAYAPSFSMAETRDGLAVCRDENSTLTAQKLKPKKQSDLGKCVYAVENLLNYYDEVNPGYAVKTDGWYDASDAEKVSGFQQAEMGIQGTGVIDSATYDSMINYMNDRINAESDVVDEPATSEPDPTPEPTPEPDPDPTPEPSPTPEPTPEPGTQKPDASNTGVPSGRSLSVPVSDSFRGISVASNGNVTISKAGTFENMLIKGRLAIKSDNVTIRYSRIEANPTPFDLPNDPQSQEECYALGPVTNQQAITSYGRSNILIEDSEIIAGRSSAFLANGIHGSGYTLRRVEIAGTVDGAGMFGSSGAPANVVVEDSFIHDLYVGAFDYGHGCKPSHSDGIQIHYGSNFSITNNTIRANSITSQKPNAGIMVNENSTYKTSNVNIIGNWIDYGGCSVNVARKNSNGIVGLKINDNLFGKNQTVVSGGVKCAMIVDYLSRDLAGNEFTGNVWEDGSLPVPGITNAGW